MSTVFSGVTREAFLLTPTYRWPMTKEQAWAKSSEWQPVAEELHRLTVALDAWASVVLTPLPYGEALKCAAHFRLPEDWAAMENRLDSGGMNARAFTTQTEVVDNERHYTGPPTDEPLSVHRITTSAVVLVEGVGTLEVLANTDEYRFEETHLESMRKSAELIASTARAF
jgi:hypothetical protein